MGKREEAVALEFIGYFRDTWPADFDAPLSLVTEDAYYQSVVPVTAPIRGKAAIKRDPSGLADRFTSFPLFGDCHRLRSRPGPCPC